MSPVAGGGFGTFRGMSELLGYARVFTTGQDVAMQTDALTGVRCARVWVEHVTSPVLSE